MRWVAGLFILLALALVGGYIFVKGWPYRIYSSWVSGKEWDRYYSISNYQQAYLLPNGDFEVPVYKEDYAQLWRPFPLLNTMVPLPTRHPMFQTIPVIEVRGHNGALIGMIITGPDKREITRLYTLETTLMADHTQGQELFKLPYVKNRIMKQRPDALWKDIFTRKIVPGSKSLDEMIHDLYVLHLRSKTLPRETVKYGLLKDGRAIVELASKDNDYVVELIMSFSGGKILSYVLRTAKDNPESQKLRSKLIAEIEMRPVDAELGRVLYTEFKQLGFARQVDQEGLLYLFSAWTQDMEKIEFLKDMIFYLERGKINSEQLKALYQYAFKKYGKTFTTRNILTDVGDENLLLQRNIELEAIDKRMTAEKLSNGLIEVREPTVQEKMDAELRKAKEAPVVEGSDMTVH
jgi:hypothetical protein